MTQVTLDSLLASLEEPGLAKQASEAPQAAATSAGKELENILTKRATEVNTVNAQQKGQAIADSVVALLKQANEAGNRVITETAAQVAGSSAGIAETPRQGNSITNTLQGLVANGIANGAVRPDALDEHLDQGGDEGHGGQALYASDEHDINATNEGSEGNVDDEVEKTAALIELVDQGVDFNTAVDLIKQAEVELLDEEYEQVKQAAVVGLLNEGMDIESAVQLVKVAMQVDAGMVKEASPAINLKFLGQLAQKDKAMKLRILRANDPTGKRHGDLERNIIHSKAVADAQASANEIPEGMIEKIKRKYGQAGSDFRGMIGATGYRMDAAKGFITNPAVYGTAAAVGVPAVGAYAYNHREKRAAAVGYLLGQGYDVDQALQLVDGE